MNITTTDKPTDSELLEICSNAIHFITTESKFEWKDIEQMVKMITYIHQNISVEGNKNTSSDNELKKRLYYMGESILIPAFLKHVTMNSNSIYNAVIVDNIISYVNKNLSHKMDIQNIAIKTQMYEHPKRKQLYVIIRNFFSLPLSKIDTALNRILLNVEFDILGYIFCEDQHSIYYEKCIILENMICNAMKDGQNNTACVAHFRNSIFKCVANSSKGKSLYRLCLTNKYFRQSILSFFETYLSSLKLDVANGHQYVQNDNLKNYILQEVLYTIYLTMDSIGGTNEFNFSSYRGLFDYINLVFL
ncbi:uncharacterized protein LOC142240990 [Haematobia irritans]|uniref:uncharacterized protein LOC142240990 n=1 Tax=Haematobia irritans TaxID=7368 RepID=UPI003F4FD4E9